MKLHHTTRTLLLLLTSCLLAACSDPREALEKTDLSDGESLALIRERIDFDALVYNDFIPKDDEATDSSSERAAELTPLKVGFSWVANDQVAPWFVGQKMGFFADEGVVVEIVEGGPGRDHLLNLIGGKIDVFVGAAEPVLNLLTSPTGADVVMLGATLKGSSAGWVTLDETIPPTERSTRTITAEDIRGKRVGLQAGNEFYGQFVCDQLGIDPSEFTLLTAGATPDALISGAMDFFQCWIVNQPRILERAGYKNWIAVTFNELGYESYMDISIVTRNQFEQSPEALRGYIRGLARSMQYLVENPDEAAQIVADSLDPIYELSVDDVKWRFEREFPLYKGDGSEPLLEIDAAKVERLGAMLIQYGQIKIVD